MQTIVSQILYIVVIDQRCCAGRGIVDVLSRCCGTFNLMWAAVQYLQRVQKGVGASSVSVLYSQRCHQKYDLLWQLPAIVGLPNPMPDEERVKLPEGEVLHEFKAKAKAIVQERCARLGYLRFTREATHSLRDGRNYVDAAVPAVGQPPMTADSFS